MKKRFINNRPEASSFVFRWPLANWPYLVFVASLVTLRKSPEKSLDVFVYGRSARSGNFKYKCWSDTIFNSAIAATINVDS